MMTCIISQPMIFFAALERAHFHLYLGSKGVSCGCVIWLTHQPDLQSKVTSTLASVKPKVRTYADFFFSHRGIRGMRISG